MAFEMLLTALRALYLREPTVKDSALRLKILNGALVRMGQIIQLTFRNAVRGYEKLLT